MAPIGNYSRVREDFEQLVLPALKPGCSIYCSLELTSFSSFGGALWYCFMMVVLFYKCRMAPSSILIFYSFKVCGGRFPEAGMLAPKTTPSNQPSNLKNKNKPQTPTPNLIPQIHERQSPSLKPSHPKPQTLDPKSMNPNPRTPHLHTPTLQSSSPKPQTPKPKSRRL